MRRTQNLETAVQRLAGIIVLDDAYNAVGLTELTNSVSYLHAIEDELLSMRAKVKRLT